VNYGYCLHHGHGINRDLMKSAEFFKSAADRCECVGQFNYGLCCYHGFGVPIDFVEAAEYFKFSADQGYGPAIRAYSSCLSLGHGVPVNRDVAAEYLRRSNEVGDILWSTIRRIDDAMWTDSIEVPGFSEADDGAVRQFVATGINH